MLDLESSINDLRGAKLFNDTSGFRWFGYVDDTVVIFVLFGLLFFIACLIINTLIGVVSRKYNKQLEWLTSGVIILILSYFTTVANFTIWFSYYLAFNVFRNFSIIFLPTFLLLRFAIQTVLKSDFVDK